MKPNFLIVGSKRCGTTSLWQALREHPGVHVANEKELNFFSTLFPHTPVDWYESQFLPEKDKHFPGAYIPGVTPTGEASPTYCFVAEAMQRISEYDPNMKLIMILRNPVQRAISHYWWEVRMQNEKRTIQEALLSDDAAENHILRSYKGWGRYHEQLAGIYKFFPPDQLLVLFLEQLASQPQETIGKATKFIGASDWDGYSFRVQLKLDYSMPYPEVIQHLQQYFIPYNERLEEFFIDTSLWKS